MTGHMMASRGAIPILFGLLVSGCAIDIGSKSPAPVSHTELRMETANADMQIAPATDLVIARASARLVLPPLGAVARGRVVTVRCAGACERLRLEAAAGELVEGASYLELEAGEMATVVADPLGQWTVISTSDL